VTAEKLAKNAVTNEKILNSAVTNAKLASEAVSTGKLENGAVTTTKIANGAVKAGQLGTVIRRAGTTVSVPAGDTALGSANCLSGEVRLSGGAFWTNGFNAALAKEMHVVHSFPASSEDTWTTRMYNGSGEAQEFIPYVLCLGA
jgi:hypothetical protein